MDDIRLVESLELLSQEIFFNADGLKNYIYDHRQYALIMILLIKSFIWTYNSRIKANNLSQDKEMDLYKRTFEIIKRILSNNTDVLTLTTYIIHENTFRLHFVLKVKELF